MKVGDVVWDSISDPWEILKIDRTSRIVLLQDLKSNDKLEVTFSHFKRECGYSVLRASYR